MISVHTLFVVTLVPSIVSMYSNTVMHSGKSGYCTLHKLCERDGSAVRHMHISIKLPRETKVKKGVVAAATLLSGSEKQQQH
jgi:hypothetical protein